MRTAALSLTTILSPQLYESAKLSRCCSPLNVYLVLPSSHSSVINLLYWPN